MSLEDVEAKLARFLEHLPDHERCLDAGVLGPDLAPAIDGLRKAGLPDE
jgi:hypothetical protein